MTDWDSIYNAPEDRAPGYGKCDVCGRRDATVMALIYIPAIGEPVEDGFRRCPQMCGSCLEDEPSVDELARKAIG